MGEFETLAYISTANRELAADELDALLVDARAFNATAGLTGVLFHAPGKFFQVLEGRRDAIDQVLERIRSSKAHSDIRMLLRQPIDARQFASWHMGFANAPQSMIQELSQAAWEDALPLTRSTMETPPGISIALEYWARWTAEQPQFA